MTTATDVTFVGRLTAVYDELMDIAECVDSYRDDLGEEEAKQRPSEFSLLKGVLHKTQEASGKVANALEAAIQADRASRGLDIFTGTPLPPPPDHSMFTDEGNVAVEEMLVKLKKTIDSGMGSRRTLVKHVKERMAEVATKHPEIHDTEPEWSIVDWVNLNICEPEGWVPISRDDF